MATKRQVEPNDELVDAIGGRNTEAVRADLDSLRSAGKLRPDSETLQAAALTLALMLDLDAEVSAPQAVKELRATMSELRVDGASTETAALLASLGTAVPTPLRDASKPRSGDARSAGRTGDGGVGGIPNAVAAARPRRRA